MFDAVLNRAQNARSRFGTGTFISIVLHGGLLVGALWISTAPSRPEVKERELSVVTWVPPKGNPGVLRTEPAQPTPRNTVRPKPRPDKLAVNTKIAEPKPDLPDTPPPPDTISNPNPENRDGPPGTSGGGPSCPSCRPDGDAKAPLTNDPPSGAPLIFDAGGMTRPVQLEGRDPSYTREALEARVEGTLVARCVITTEGKLEDCNILKGLPHMEQAVLQSLATRRYQPVTYQGQPVAVRYVFNIRMMLPH